MDRSKGSPTKRGMIRVKDPEKSLKVDPEGLFVDTLKDLLRRTIGAQKIVLELAELEVSAGSFFGDAVLRPLIQKARKYVSKEMREEVGVRKLTKQWEAEEGFNGQK